MSTTSGYSSGLSDDIGVVENLVFLDSHEQYVSGIGRPGRIQDLIVQVHVRNIKRNVLFGLPLNGLF